MDSMDAQKPNLSASEKRLVIFLKTGAVVFKTGFMAAFFSIFGAVLGSLVAGVMGLALEQGQYWGWFLGAAVGLLFGRFCTFDEFRSVPNAKSRPDSENDPGSHFSLSREGVGRREFFRPVLMFTLAGGTLGFCLGMPIMIVLLSIMMSPWAPPGWDFDVVMWPAFALVFAGLIIGAIAGIILAIVHPFREVPNPTDTASDSQKFS